MKGAGHHVGGEESKHQSEQAKGTFLSGSVNFFERRISWEGSMNLERRIVCVKEAACHVFSMHQERHPTNFHGAQGVTAQIHTAAPQRGNLYSAQW